MVTLAALAHRLANARVVYLPKLSVLIPYLIDRYTDCERGMVTDLKTQFPALSTFHALTIPTSPLMAGSNKYRFPSKS